MFLSGSGLEINEKSGYFRFYLYASDTASGTSTELTTLPMDPSSLILKETTVLE